MGDEMGLSARLAEGPGSAVLLFRLSVMYCLVELHRLFCLANFHLIIVSSIYFAKCGVKITYLHR